MDRRQPCDASFTGSGADKHRRVSFPVWDNEQFMVVSFLAIVKPRFRNDRATKLISSPAAHTCTLFVANSCQVKFACSDEFSSLNSGDRKLHYALNGQYRNSASCRGPSAATVLRPMSEIAIEDEYVPTEPHRPVFHRRVNLRCSTYNDCQFVGVHNGFLAVGSSVCPKVTEVLPANVSLYETPETNVMVKVNLLPPPADGGLYQCIFESSYIPAEYLPPDTLRCQLPKYEERPKIPDAQDSITVQLKVWSGPTGVVFVSTPFTFYDCAQHVLCTSCVSSRWQCDWCLHDNRCVRDNEICSNQNDENDSGVHLHTNSCPHIDRQDLFEVLLPDSSPTSITVPVSNLDKLLDNDRNQLICATTIEGSEIRVRGSLSMDEKKIKCEDYAYTYDLVKPSLTTDFQLRTQKGIVIDKVKVQIYKCELMAVDCSRCVSLESRYGCVWCEGSCRFIKLCHHFLPNAVQRQDSSICPAPAILDVVPLSGPFDGGTKVRITGRDLGVRQRDVENRVFIAGVPCRLVEYVLAEKIICVTDQASGEISGPVEVILENGKSGMSRNNFVFVNPTLTGFHPTIGPQSGGTEVIISGNNLLDASNIEVLLGDVPCSIQSGGRSLYLRGSYLNAIQRPLMYFIDEIGQIQSETAICKVVNGSFMICPSPRLIPIVDRVRRSDFKLLDYIEPNELVTGEFQLPLDSGDFRRFGIGFIMDGVKSVKNLGQSLAITVVPDPVYHGFDGQQKIYREGPLIIAGKYLNLASSSKEVIVTVGSKPCNVTLIVPSQLVCHLPVREPRQVASSDGTDDEDSDEGLVTVKVGNLQYKLGRLVYESQPVFTSVSMSLMGGLVGGLCSLLFIGVVAVAMWWRRKSWQAERDYKRIQMQMDSLESNVRQECKEAYTVPLDSSVDHFEQLLWNPHFVLMFVTALESQARFAASDKVYVASLITVVLIRNMQYLTEVVLLLLRQLIARSAKEKFPHLMLRRTESVVEKMLANWIALCLYDYVQQGAAGGSLFLLYTALKHQVEKGPVDECTANARYSLSEDRLLKEQIDYEPLMLRVIPPCAETHNAEGMVSCRVLSCDSINEVKSKVLDCLYRNTPFRSRPVLRDVDLEWHDNVKGCVKLHDHDYFNATSKDSWCKLNTLGDYHISNGAVIVVNLKKSSGGMCGGDTMHTYASIDSCSRLLSRDSFNESYVHASIYGYQNSVENLERGVRYWHLSKPDGSSNCRGSPSLIPEIYLTRLLSTKGTVQKFIDDFFYNALRVTADFPAPVKYLFDFFEHESGLHDFCDASGVVLAWKNNSLPLRFWVNVIKNPDFVYDVEKTPTVDACLSVIAQTFMDACSMSEQRLGKDSPSNKLLFARDLPRYRAAFSRFYSGIKRLPPVSEQELNAQMANLSSLFSPELNSKTAVCELLTYAVRYKEEVNADFVDLSLCDSWCCIQ
ncbi:unnamed protein product [Soboliphyme baturini]|uniref:Sema domain-containing protein n=1 Tax=Soboliphyme baturini TaxID=241478 RepID=A0A183IG17_9BILA|nr:unnamed protein product [Soboliphyme baturini]